MSSAPQVGEYYKHFKHDSEKGVVDHIYQIVGVGCHTETEDILVVYKPLYISDFLNEKKVDCFCRPISMFLDNVEKENYTGPRFIKIEDVETVDQLKKL